MKIWRGAITLKTWPVCPVDNPKSLRIDCDDKKIWSSDCPIETGVCLVDLQHVPLVSRSVHVRFTASIYLQTFAVLTRKCISLQVATPKFACLHRLMESGNAVVVPAM